MTLRSLAPMNRVGAVTWMLILGEVHVLASTLLLWPLIQAASSLWVPGLFLVLVVAWAIQTAVFYRHLRQRVAELHPVSWADMKNKPLEGPVEEFGLLYLLGTIQVVYFPLFMIMIPVFLMPSWWLSANPPSGVYSPGVGLWTIIVGIGVVIGGHARMRELGGWKPGSRAGLARDHTVLMWPLLTPAATFLLTTLLALSFKDRGSPQGWVEALVAHTAPVLGLVGVGITFRLIAWTSGLDRNV
jgi:hypothetical protein